MSGGHFEYMAFWDGGWANQIQSVINEGNTDVMGIGGTDPFAYVGHDNYQILHKSLDYLTDVQSEVQSLVDRLEQLIGVESKAIGIMNAFDKFYSDDVTTEGLLELLKRYSDYAPIP